MSSSIGHLSHKEYRMLEWIRQVELQTRFKALRHRNINKLNPNETSIHNSAPYKLLQNE